MGELIQAEKPRLWIPAVGGQEVQVREASCGEIRPLSFRPVNALKKQAKEGQIGQVIIAWDWLLTKAGFRAINRKHSNG